MPIYDVVMTGAFVVTLAALAVQCRRLRQMGRDLAGRRARQAASTAELRLARERQRRVVGWMEEFADPCRKRD